MTKPSEMAAENVEHCAETYSESDDGKHCKHYHEGESYEGGEPDGDPGDGLGVQGYCCQCDAIHPNMQH